MDDGKHRPDAERAPDVSKTGSGERRKKRAKFEPPEVISYSGDDILEDVIVGGSVRWGVRVRR